MQEEIESVTPNFQLAPAHLSVSSLLLEALMPTTPPPSVFERSTEREIYYSRAHGMDVDSDPQRDQASMSIHHLNQPMHHDNSRSRHPQANGKTNGNTSNRPRRYSMEVCLATPAI